MMCADYVCMYVYVCLLGHKDRFTYVQDHVPCVGIPAPKLLRALYMPSDARSFSLVGLASSSLVKVVLAAHMYVYAHIYVCVCMSIDLCMHTYLCVCVCMYAH